MFIERTEETQKQVFTVNPHTPTNISLSTLTILFAIKFCEGDFSQCLVYSYLIYIMSHSICFIELSFSYALVGSVRHPTWKVSARFLL